SWAGSSRPVADTRIQIMRRVPPEDREWGSHGWWLQWPAWQSQESVRCAIRHTGELLPARYVREDHFLWPGLRESELPPVLLSAHRQWPYETIRRDPGLSLSPFGFPASPGIWRGGRHPIPPRDNRK